MPMDGFTLSFLQRELKAALVGGRVDKVNQPEKDTLLILIRSQGENHRLLLSANASQARAQLTAQSYENPAEPPMFCMLMRKHLVGYHVMDVAQLGGDRILSLTFEGIGELGDMARKTLYLEMMGRHSNLTLVDAEGTIVDAIHHVNSEMSRVRTVLPGQPYHLPPAQDKLSPEAISAQRLTQRLASLTCPLFKGLMETVAGMATVCAKEVCAQVGLEPGTPVGELDWAVTGPALARFYEDAPGLLAPVALYDEAGAALDFFPFPYRTFDKDQQQPMPSLSAAMDAFYLGRDLRQRMQQRSAGLQKHVQNAIDRLEKKKRILVETLQASEHAEDNRICGELLTAHLHTLVKGQEKVSLTNYYDPEQREIEILLDNQLTPNQNAQRYYKKYRKAKVAAQYAQEQLEIAERELVLLEGALDDLEKSTTSTDLAEVRQVLMDSGYLRPDPAQRKKKKLQEGKPYRFTAPDGTEIWVGKNSLQNDRLTLHAKGEEIWLHAQGMPGSHVIIKTEQEPSEEALLKAAKLAAYFSRGRNHPMLPVDWTRRKHVKKAAGSPSGFVTYTRFQTVIIGLTPEDIAAIQKESAAGKPA